MAEDLLLSARGLTKTFTIGRSLLPWVRNETFNAVDGIDLAIRKGRTLAVVGESGSGKSTLGRLLLRLIEATSGSVDYGGVDLFAMPAQQLHAQRRKMQIVFQDPYGSLDPYIPIGRTIEESLLVYALGDAAARRGRVAELLTRVGLDPESASRYPHAFSGGQRQRISIARALAVNPEFIVCDEPVSALDVSVQAQIINLLLDLQDSLGLTYLFISHDLGVVRQMADEIAVMYRGRIVEIGDKRRIYASPAHPYTQALLASMPSYDFSDGPRSLAIDAEAGNQADNGSGCRFRARCPLARTICAEVVPALVPIESDHSVACHAVAN